MVVKSLSLNFLMNYRFVKKQGFKFVLGSESLFSFEINGSFNGQDIEVINR